MSACRKVRYRDRAARLPLPPLQGLAPDEPGRGQAMTDPDPWTCPHCGARFSVPSLTRDHIRTEHEESK